MSQVLNHATAVMLLLWTLSSMVVAQTRVHEDFEDGTYHADASSMAIAPRLVTEQGNTFLRITGRSSDDDGLEYCGGHCPHRNRSTIAFTKEASLAHHPTRWTYRADLRIVQLASNALEVNPISITVNTAEGYCGHRFEVFGPQSLYTWKRPGHYYFDRRLHGAGGSFNVDLGAYHLSDWHTLTLDAVFSKNPHVGRLNISVDGQLKKTWTGNTHPTCGWLTPEVRYGLYGDYSTGIVNLDNIHIFPTGTGGGDGSVPPPSAPPSPPVVTSLPPPTNFRVCEWQGNCPR